MVVLNLQPVAQLDYKAFNKLRDRGKMTGVWLEHCQSVSLPEVANVFNRSRIRYGFVTGYLNDDTAWSEIEDWVEAAKVAVAMRFNRMGLLGHYYGGMLDVYTDLTLQSAAFGTHFEMLEMCELKKYRDEVNEMEIKRKVEEFKDSFDVSTECDPAEIDRAAQTSVALDKLIENNKLGAMAYYYEGQAGNGYENIVT